VPAAELAGVGKVFAAAVEREPAEKEDVIDENGGDAPEGWLWYFSEE
jgi:hypothetical protein